MADRLTIPMDAVGLELRDAIASGRVAYITDALDDDMVRAMVLPPIVQGSMLSDGLAARNRLVAENARLVKALRDAEAGLVSVGAGVLPTVGNFVPMPLLALRSVRAALASHREREDG